MQGLPANNLTKLVFIGMQRGEFQSSQVTLNDDQTLF